MSNNATTTPIVAGIVEELIKLQEAHDILYELYLIHLTPYNNDLPYEMNRKLRQYFDFDDSE